MATVHLAEGDLLLLRGSRVVSDVVSLLAGGVSHCGVVLRINRRLCLCHSTPNPARISSVFGVTHSGVIATPVTRAAASGFYAKALVFRFHEMDAKKIRAMRAVFEAEYGRPYERNWLSLLCSAMHWNPVATRDSLSCSELCARMFAEAELFDGDVHAALPNEFHARASLVGSLALVPVSRKWRYSLGHAPALSKAEATRIRAAWVDGAREAR